MLVALLLATLGADARAPAVPRREIPAAVLTELRQLEDRFDAALVQDCAAERCFSRGCTYVEHGVADQPRQSSLPGLGEEAGPGAVTPQAYLTKARCGFAHEKGAESSDLQILARRLQSRMSGGWLSVSVVPTALPELPVYLRDAPEEEPEEAAEEVPPEPAPEELPPAEPKDELWSALLPHFYWMVGIALFTFATALLIWAWRRLGRASLEEQALLAELSRDATDGGDDAPEGVATAEPAGIDSEVTSQDLEARAESWTKRLESMDPSQPDPTLQALVRALLRAGEIPLLAKAVLSFPQTFPAVFPRGGDVATAKLELADYLRTADPNQLPTDAEFFSALDRHALAAALATQSDTEIVRSLREDFGASGLAALIARLPPRRAGLLFTLAPASAQHELVRLLKPSTLVPLSEALLASNRLDEGESAWLFAALKAARGKGVAPEAPETEIISDQGATIGVPATLSLLLPRLPAEQSGELRRAALTRFAGTLPHWYHDILIPEMLGALSTEARADLFLGIEVDALAAWRSVQTAEDQSAVTAVMPIALQSSLADAANFSSREAQIAAAERGRRALCKALQASLKRRGVSFADAFVREGDA